MNLEQFATLAGVEIEDCDPEWGGRDAYKLADYPYWRSKCTHTK